MAKTEAKRLAAKGVVSRLQGILDAGWPQNMRDDKDPPEKGADLQRTRDGMEQLIAGTERTYRI